MFQTRHHAALLKLRTSDDLFQFFRSAFLDLEEAEKFIGKLQEAFCIIEENGGDVDRYNFNIGVGIMTTRENEKIPVLRLTLPLTETGNVAWALVLDAEERITGVYWIPNDIPQFSTTPSSATLH